MGLLDTLSDVGRTVQDIFTDSEREKRRRREIAANNATIRRNQNRLQSLARQGNPRARTSLQSFQRQNIAPSRSFDTGAAGSQVLKSLPRQFAQDLARLPVRVGLMGSDKLLGINQSITPGNTVSKFLWGTEPINSTSVESQRTANQIFQQNTLPNRLASNALTGLDLSFGAGSLVKSPAKTAIKTGIRGSKSFVDDVPRTLQTLATNEVGAIRNARPPKVPVARTAPPRVPNTPSSNTRQELAKVINERLNKRVEAESSKYSSGLFSRAKQSVGDAYNPARVLRNVDLKTARARGLKYRDLPASERLEAGFDRTINSAQQAEEILKTPTRTGRSGVDLIRKYGEGTNEGKMFNNYANAKFDLEFRGKHGKPIQRNISDEELQTFVKSYEANNPDALADLATSKALNDQAVDLLVDAGALSRAEGTLIKNSYENAVPLQRVIPEDLERISIGARPTGSIGRQTVIQKLVGNSDTPLENSFEPLIRRINKAVNQSNRAKLAQAYAARVNEGTAPGKLLVGAGNKAARKEIRETNKQINDAIKSVNQQLRTAKADDDISVLQAQLADLEQAKGINKGSIAQLQDDPVTGKQVISGLVDGQPFKMEVPPEIARALQGLGEQELPALLKMGYGANKVFQTAWTGFLQPVFSLFSYMVYDPLASTVISKQGFKNFRPGAIAQAIKSFKSSNEFSTALRRNGYLSPGGSQLARDTKLTAEKIAAADSVFKKMKFNIRHPSEMRESLDVLGGKLANSSRERIAKSHYLAAKKQGLSEQQAIEEAVYAANNVLPNYQRTSNLVRQFNSVVPYSGASVAGTRALLGALRTDPTAWGRLAAVAVAPPVAATAYTLSSESGQAFIQDMLDSEKGYTLDNNLIIALPGAFKRENGAWEGIWKIPVPPEFRAIHKSVWRGAATAMNDGSFGADPKTVAASIFDSMTGGLRGQQNPIVNTGLAWLNIDSRDFEPIVEGDLAYEDKKDQSYPTTSTAGKTLASLTGNRISPIQGDTILGQFSLAGQLVQNKSGSPLATLSSNLRNRVYGAFGQKEGSKFFEEFDRLIKETKLEPDDRDAIMLVHSKNPTPGILDSAEKAKIYLNRPKVVEFDRKLDQWTRKQGKPGNPIFDLSDDQLHDVMTYRAAKMLNAGKQTYDKQGNPLFTSLGLDAPWYDKFRDQESKFYDKIKKEKVSSLKKEISQTKDSKELSELNIELKEAQKEDEDFKTFSGAQKPNNPKMEKLQEQYFKLPDSTGERSSFLRAHPELLDYWEASSGFTNKERKAIGLKTFDDDEGSSFRKYSSRGGSSSSGGFGGGVEQSVLDDILKAMAGVDTSASFRKPSLQSKIKRPGAKQITVPSQGNQKLTVRKTGKPV